MSPRISQVVLVTATHAELEHGLIGWVSFNIHEALRVDGFALRQRLDGKLTLAFPWRKGKTGHQRPYLRPLDAQARAVIERQVFEALGLKENVA